MDDVKTDGNDSKSRRSFKESINSLFEHIGIGRNGILFAACCLAAAPLVQAVWTFAMYHFIGFPAFGPWHTLLGYLYLEGRITVLPLVVFLLTVCSWNRKLTYILCGIVSSIVTAAIDAFRWDYLSLGIYALVAIPLVCLLYLEETNRE